MKVEQLSRGFQLQVADTPEEVASAAAQVMADALRAKPDLLLCAATGSSPTRAYELLVGWRKLDPSLFEDIRVVKLDEWGQLPMDHPGSCEAYLQKHLLQPLDIPPNRYLSFQSQADPAEECARVVKALGEQGPIGLCILGLGLNGHLGFNEPADALHEAPHRATLASSSLQHTMVRDSGMALSYGLTLGMGHILQSEKILLLVTGPHKTDAMRQLLSRRITTQFPASFLWLHRDVVCLCDRAAIPA